jgi:serine/threonine-protein kinase
MTQGDANLDEVDQIQLLDELLLAIQDGNAGRRDELLHQYPEFEEWLDCFQLLDRFASAPVGLDFPSTIPGSDSPVSHPSDSSTPAARVFGKYELLSEIGRGGMGIVYKARQPDLNRIVALKMIQASEWASPEEISRFRAEARATARLRHRNIVGIYEVGEELGRHFFAMDFIEGQSLAAVIGHQPLPPEKAARWMVPIAQAVEHLHSQGVIHRDLKPANILIDRHSEPMVTDFGLAKMFDTDGGTTRTGAILGTPSYMSPEQASGRNSQINARSDVYSLGAVLYEMLSGRPPFREEKPLDTLVQVLEGEATLLSTLVPTIPRELELICFKCLEKDPGRRYACAADLAADLTRYLHGDPVEAQSGGFIQALLRWARRQPGLACRLAVLIPITATIQVYFMASGANLTVHLRVIGLLLAWMGLSVLWQKLLRRESLATASRIGSMLTDASISTALFVQVAEFDCGQLVIIYALLIMVSGLWFQEPLVWSSTVIVEAAFGVLLIYRPELFNPWHYPLLVAITLIASAAVTSFQGRRVRALSRFYDRRPI